MNKIVDKMQGSLIRKIYESVSPSSVDLGLGQININPVIETIDTINTSVKNTLNYRYTPTQGIDELRELIVQRHNSKNNMQYTPYNVLVTAGASAAISSAYLAMLCEKSNVVIPEIAYPTYEMVPKMIGEGKYEIRSFKLDEDFLPNISDLEKKVDENSILILNSPNNPTGAIIPPKTIDKISYIAKTTGAKVISDEVYSEIYFDHTPESIGESLQEQTIVVDSLSKCGLVPGLRIGWAIAPVEIIENVTKAHQLMNSCVSSISQYAAIGILKNQWQFEKLRNQMNINRDKLKNFLDEKGFKSNPSGGIYCFVNTSNFGKSVEASKKILYGADVVTIPGKAFGERGDDFVRISYGVDEDTLEEGIKRLNKFL